jgi:hypothetical protein
VGDPQDHIDHVEALRANGQVPERIFTHDRLRMLT